MKRFILLISLLSLNSFSQVGGESVYNFLNLTGSAKQAALGGKTLTLMDDVNQPLWNPSVISQELDNRISVNYLNYLADVNLTSAAFAHMVSQKFGTLHGGITYLNYGKFVGADENGLETGIFKAYDLAVSLGYSYNIFKTDLFVGANVKLINSVIDNYSSVGIASDWSLLYYSDEQPYVFTLVIRNLGYQVTVFDETREKLPLQIEFGASYALENVPIIWHFTVDNLQQWNISVNNPSNASTDIDGNIYDEEISFFENSFRHVSIGAELFSEGAFNLRFGYNFRRAYELRLIDKRTFAGFTAGFGLKMNKLKFNYAFSKYHPASNANTFSLQIDLN
ncbi:MAG: type IX secretion system protein PorQ [Lutibacter sp.]|uniref:type IX secretion system protein PorQ n=1 Tax=Lutibacter sp. TaxID=1925666 RepID=UPI001820DFAF|nr:type IX secretion system protein PorQ [Lutibacter sp.]MBT8317285.1 type IX secretion system protein PorQ [Lutibacter sp.]NNJ58144.1 type IX secretion system protein PorQ [Lutibacter sp.]